jgi:dipeptidyl aminopeptidase/acylaminoacyl peptidase
MTMRVPATIAFALFTCSAIAAPMRGFDVDDLVRLERVADPRLSPDGREVAFALRETDYAANKGLQSIWRLALDGAARPQRLTTVGQNAASPRWSPDGRALYFLSPRSGSNQLWRLPLDGGEAVQVSDYPLDIGTYQLSPDGRRVALTFEVFVDCDTLACSRARIDAKAARKESGQVFDRLHARHWDSWSSGRRSQLFVAELGADGRAAAAPTWLSKGIDGDVLSRPSPDASEYAWSPDGRSLAFSANVQGRERAWNSNSDLYLVASDGASAPRNLTAANKASDNQPLFAPDGRTLFHLATARPQVETDRAQIMAIDLASGTTRKIAADWDRSAGALQVSRDGRSLYTLADDDGERPLFAIDVKSGALRNLTGAGNVIGAAVGANAIVFVRDTLTSPAQLFALDAKRGTARALTDFNRERLADVTMGEPEFFDFKGWKDERVEGYVVKPWNYEAGKKYPIAFLVHGGPHAPFGNAWHYRWNAQTYAGQGYAVVAINFHGSGGYGQAFTDSIVGAWGDSTVDDLQKGLAAAVAKYDWLDRDRACALGASYGGYMMNWILGRWPDGFDCLVSHGGIIDTRFFAYSIDSVGFMERQMVGTPFANPEQFERYNPVNHVAQWKTPTLVIHGALDYRVPLEEGIALFTALQRRGIESKFLLFPDENHWVLKPHNSVQWHREVEAWLKAYLR